MKSSELFPFGEHQLMNFSFLWVSNFLKTTLFAQWKRLIPLFLNQEADWMKYNTNVFIIVNLWNLLAFLILFFFIWFQVFYGFSNLRSVIFCWNNNISSIIDPFSGINHNGTVYVSNQYPIESTFGGYDVIVIFDSELTSFPCSFIDSFNLFFLHNNSFINYILYLYPMKKIFNFHSCTRIFTHTQTLRYLSFGKVSNRID